MTLPSYTFVVTAGILLGASCGLGSFECESDDDCGSEMLGAGICEVSGYCSFEDTACDSGQRYGGHAPESLAQKCVIEGPAGTNGERDDTDASTVDPSTSSGSSTTMATVTEPETTAVAVTGDVDSDGIDIDPDLGIWLSFDSGALDPSMYGHVPMCVSSCPTSTAGMFGQASLFDRTGHLSIDYAADEAFDGDFTVSVWIFLANTQSSGSVVFKAGGADPAMQIEVGALTSGTRRELVVRVGPATLTADDAFAAGEWSHVALVRASNGVRVVVNREELLVGTSSGVDAINSPMLLGGTPPLEHSALVLDDFRIYHRALSDSELDRVFAGEAL